MKNIIKSGFGFALAILMMLVACDPNEFDKSDLNIGTVPTAEDVSFTIVPGDDEFHFVLTNNTTVEGIHIVKWDLGNGTVATGNEVVAYYPTPDTYDVTLTITVNSGETASKSDQIVQTETDYAFLDSPLLNMLTGGSSVLEGKTWVVDSLGSGHYGIGPAGGNWPEWWAASPLQKTGSGSYDDEFTFKMVEFVFEYHNNGDSYVKDYQKTNPNYSNPVEVDGVDCKVDFTPGNATWAVVEREGANYLVLTSDKPSFFGFDYGATNNEFRIEGITENTLQLSCIGGDGNRWYNNLIVKGYEVPVVEKPLQENDIMDDFEGNGNVVWNLDDIVAFETITNFAPLDPNTSENIARYTKDGFEWTNVKTVLDYRIDLTSRNVFTMKVFIPSFNDYVTECDPGTPWLSEHNLKPQIDVKLQDSKKGGSAWETQQVRGYVFTEDQLGKWVELTFDFSDVSDRTDFDQIIIQLGAEGHCNSGIFYIDDFMLLD
ncbi:PKD domain-containing protein [Marinifilum sp. D737]|uniref:PKD domain-containing protein n=1 Tax=Marinifilum sp. D737 TaxID=2969628 RepID=UPI002275795A|nr:PKD domain-containing protein [Marinifilum sp. D737]MCY1635796.1 PKD domain-containing protein [Marinifilum sp. D737]